MFDLLEELDGGQVVLDSNKTYKVQGIESITLRMYDGTHQTLKGVRCVLGLKRNLISLGALDHTGHTFKAEKGKMIVTKGSFVVMKAMRSNGLYVLDVSTTAGSSSLLEHDQNK